VKAYLAQKTFHIPQPRLVQRKKQRRKKQRRKNQLKRLKVKNTLDSSELTTTYCVRLTRGTNEVDYLLMSGAGPGRCRRVSSIASNDKAQQKGSFGCPLSS
jgi:hypothetical protein